MNNWSYSPDVPHLGQNRQFCLAVWPWNLTDDLDNNRAPFLCYFKLCASFRSPWWFQTSYSPETPNLGQIRRFSGFVTLKFDGYPWKTIEHLFYTTSSFVHHFVAIGEFKLELRSRDALFGSNSIFSRMKFDRWPWKTIVHLSKATSSFVHYFIIVCEFKLELRSGTG